MTIADKTELIKMLGDPSAATVTDAELNSAIAFGDAEVRRRVGVVPSTGDPEYPSFQVASQQFALYIINSKFPDLVPGAKNAYNVAVSTCDSIVQRDTDVDPDSGTPIIEVGDYQSFPLNPDATYRFATRTRGGIGPTYRDVVTSGYWVL